MTNKSCKCVSLFFFQGINRTLLSWLRLWDEVVFGCPPPLKNAGDSGPSGHGPSRHKASFGDKRKRNIASDTGNRKKATTKEKKFEKWFEYQNPMAFADVEVCILIQHWLQSLWSLC